MWWGCKDKYDLMRFDSSGAVSAGMFDETWRRFVIKMATGSGKTKVMSLALAWSFYHKLYEPDSTLARNFLVIAPNIIVLDRIYKDFQGCASSSKTRCSRTTAYDGRNWRDDFQLTLHLQDEVRITRPPATSFLTNIHRVYAGEDIPPSPMMKTRWTTSWASGPRARPPIPRWTWA
jgi:type III restriction enzyme